MSSLVKYNFTIVYKILLGFYTTLLFILKHDYAWSKAALHIFLPPVSWCQRQIQSQKSSGFYKIWV